MIDIYHTYHLVCIAKGNKWKTIFYICYRSFKQSIILFGLTNASTIFQCFINNIFSDLFNVCVIIYLDDIQIYSNNMADYIKYVKEVLCYLQKAEKYEFHSESVEYLGYILSPFELTMASNKIKIIQDWLKPRKVKDIQSFLRFANFYYGFIYRYLDIIILLICLTQKNFLWNFDNSCHKAFDILKKRFTSVSFFHTGFPMINSSQKQMLLTILSLLFCLL